MRAVRAALLLALIPACLLAESEPAAGPENYIFFNVERERIEEPAFLEADAIVGAQLKYTWRELEPERDRHELAPVLADLRFLQKHGKRLFLQIQDVSFDERINVPDYLIEDPEFGGGVARKYEIAGGEGSAPVFSGWIARRWDPTVIARFEKLLMALGTELDGEVAGVTLPETAVDFGEGGELDPEGFTPESYAAGVKAIMTAAGRAFFLRGFYRKLFSTPISCLENGCRGRTRAISEASTSMRHRSVSESVAPTCYRIGRDSRIIPTSSSPSAAGQSRQVWLFSGATWRTSTLERESA